MDNLICQWVLSKALLSLLVLNPARLGVKGYAKRFLGPPGLTPKLGRSTRLEILLLFHVKGDTALMTLQGEGSGNPPSLQLVHLGHAEQEPVVRTCFMGKVMETGQCCHPAGALSIGQ